MVAYQKRAARFGPCGHLALAAAIVTSLALSLPLAPSPGAAPSFAAVFVQSHPPPPSLDRFERMPSEPRAIVLLHGLQLHLHPEKAARANLSGWQKPDSKLVKALAAEGDVYAFAYSQCAPVEALAKSAVLRDGVRRLREAGYTEIVLVGHSAGGLVARQFVEDYPQAGVTKVLQVCAPNSGSGYAKLDWLCPCQRVFVESLDKRSRRQSGRERANRKIPEDVQFVCVVGNAAGVGDIIVSEASQWPKDLRDQGVPAVALWTGHFWVTRNSADARKIAELVRASHPRWDAAQVAAMKKKILGD